MNKIIDPTTNKRYSIYSKQGKHLLKQYIQYFQYFQGGMSNNDKKRMNTFLLSLQRRHNNQIQHNQN